MGSDQEDTPLLVSEPPSHHSSDVAISQGPVNPFKPHDISNTITLFRHRWLHAFPRDMKGTALQEHHQKVKTDDLEPTAKVSQIYQEQGYKIFESCVG